MFEVGFTEILLIFGIALLVLGPARLPKLAADVGRWAGRARAMARSLRAQLEQEVQFDPLAETQRSTASTPPPYTPPPSDTTRATPAQPAGEPAPPPEVVAASAEPPAVTAAAVAPTPPSLDGLPRPEQAIPDESKPG